MLICWLRIIRRSSSSASKRSSWITTARWGLSVPFAQTTAGAFGQRAANFLCTLAVLDYNSDGRNRLIVMEGENSLRLLSNQGGRIDPINELLPAKAGVEYRQCLAGDL